VAEALRLFNCKNALKLRALAAERNPAFDSGRLIGRILHSVVNQFSSLPKAHLWIYCSGLSALVVAALTALRCHFLKKYAKL
jgi:hypothetical protein